MRLPEIDADADEDNRHDDDRVGALTERDRNRARGEENEHERIRKQLCKLDGRRETADVNWIVWPEFGETPRGFCAAQPVRCHGQAAAFPVRLPSNAR